MKATTPIPKTQASSEEAHTSVIPNNLYTNYLVGLAWLLSQSEQYRLEIKYTLTSIMSPLFTKHLDFVTQVWICRPGKFLGIVDQDPSVSKSNRFTC